MTHNREISYEGYANLGVKHVYVPKLVKDQIDSGEQSGFAKFFKETLEG